MLMENVVLTGNPILVSLIGLGSAVICVVIGKFWEGHLQRQKEVAILTLKSRTDSNHVVTSCNDHHDGKGAIPRCYVRAQVTSKGSPVGAKDCEVQLAEIHRQVDNTIKRIDYPNVDSLHWNGPGAKPGTFEKRFLANSKVQMVDLLFTQVINGTTSVVLKDNNYTNVGLSMGNTYFFTLNAVCENGHGTTKVLKVKIGSSYDDIVVVVLPRLAFQLLRVIGELRSRSWSRITGFNMQAT
jgi:hypothetical protein